MEPAIQKSETQTEEPSNANENECSWTGLDEFLSNIQPKDIKDLADKYSKFKHKQLVQQIIESKIKAKLACQFQWLRFILIMAASIIVAMLIYCDKFESSAALFFGGIVAYLFGKEPK